MQRKLALVAWFLAAWFAILVVRAAGVEGVLAGFGRVWALPWGRVGLVDLYLGFAVTGFWIGCLEPRPLRRVGWWLALFCLGNLATLVFLGLRLWHAPSVRSAVLGRG